MADKYIRYGGGASHCRIANEDVDFLSDGYSAAPVSDAVAEAAVLLPGQSIVSEVPSPRGLTLEELRAAVASTQAAQAIIATPAPVENVDMDGILAAIGGAIVDAVGTNVSDPSVSEKIIARIGVLYPPLLSHMTLVTQPIVVTAPIVVAPPASTGAPADADAATAQLAADAEKLATDAVSAVEASAARKSAKDAHKDASTVKG